MDKCPKCKEPFDNERRWRNKYKTKHHVTPLAFKPRGNKERIALCRECHNHLECFLRKEERKVLKRVAFTHPQFVDQFYKEKLDEFLKGVL